jgi:chromosome segregation ATPase
METERIDIAAEERRAAERIRGIEDSKLRQLDEMKNSTKQYVELSMAKVRLCLRQAVAQRDIASIEAELRDKEASIQNLKGELDEAETVAMRLKEKAKKQLDEARRLSGLKDNENDLTPGLKNIFSRLPDTVEELDDAIHSLQTRIDCISPIDAAVIHDFEQRKERIVRLQQQVTRAADALTEQRTNTNVIRERWFGPLQELIRRISVNYSEYFAAMKCAGEVDVSVPENQDDYSAYGVRIRVKFRDTEQLRELTPFQQSGGERSVSTVLYIISLQEMTRCPFRCVDEINQGMDPINERMVFDLIVKTASNGQTSQYFLLTPKLLPDLEYNDRMTVLPVHNSLTSTFTGDWNIAKFACKRRALTVSSQ